MPAYFLLLRFCAFLSKRSSKTSLKTFFEKFREKKTFYKKVKGGDLSDFFGDFLPRFFYYHFSA
jgi:hypothetical protein